MPSDYFFKLKWLVYEWFWLLPLFIKINVDFDSWKPFVYTREDFQAFEHQHTHGVSIIENGKQSS